MRVWLSILLLANLVLAGFIYVSETREPSRPPSTDLNADKMRLVPLPPEPAPAKAAEAGAGKPAACVQWNGIAVADLPRAKELLASLVPADRLVEARVEAPTRFWVYIPASTNASAVVTRLREAGVKDVSLQPDNAISLGLFSSEEAANRYLAQIRDKGFTRGRIEPRSPQVKEIALTLREPSAEIVAKLGELKGQFAGSDVRPVECPAAEKTS